jgi:hypothetical protein
MSVARAASAQGSEGIRLLQTTTRPSFSESRSAVTAVPFQHPSEAWRFRQQAPGAFSQAATAIQATLDS